MDANDFQRLVAQIALEALAGWGFALAGGNAIREHGISSRPTEDVDLFTVMEFEPHFGKAVEIADRAWSGQGLIVTRLQIYSGFAKFEVGDPEGLSVVADLGIDWREHEPIFLDVGPVIALEDAVANKILALYSRQAARDYLDVDAIRQSGRFEDSELLNVAFRHDPGFDSQLFAGYLRRVAHVTHLEASRYGVTQNQLARIVARLSQWANSIEADGPSPAV